MKATVNGRVIADSDDTVEAGGYQYFPPAAVHTEWLHKSPRTPHDLECPHGVQFYDVVIGGEVHPRNAWIYETPKPVLQHIKDRVGFWEDVVVG